MGNGKTARDMVKALTITPVEANTSGNGKTGERHLGTITWADGSEYDGDKYVGAWKDNNEWSRHYHWAHGDKYVGKWKDNKINGQGTLTWADGDKYVGAWKDGDRQGQGTSLGLIANTSGHGAWHEWARHLHLS